LHDITLTHAVGQAGSGKRAASPTAHHATCAKRARLLQQKDRLLPVCWYIPTARAEIGLATPSQRLECVCVCVTMPPGQQRSGAAAHRSRCVAVKHHVKVRQKGLRTAVGDGLAHGLAT
jgi:hypothetical protein